MRRFGGADRGEQARRNIRRRVAVDSPGRAIRGRVVGRSDFDFERALPAAIFARRAREQFNVGAGGRVQRAELCTQGVEHPGGMTAAAAQRLERDALQPGAVVAGGGLLVPGHVVALLLQRLVDLAMHVSSLGRREARCVCAQAFDPRTGGGRPEGQGHEDEGTEEGLAAGHPGSI